MIRLTRLDEFHPGAKTLPESIEFFINLGMRRGISKESLVNAINLYAGLHYGWFTLEESPKYRRDSDEFAGLKQMADAIETMQDDGYPEEWIYRAFADYLLGD